MSESDHKEDGARQDADRDKESSAEIQPDSSTLVSQEDTQLDASDPDEDTSLEGSSDSVPSCPPQQADQDVNLEPGVDDEEKPEKSDKSWYVVHTYSGYENKARQTLLERIKRENMDDFFGQILIPTEEVVEMKRGKRRTSKRKFFPGYMLVQMRMNEQSWYLVKSTPKITGFVGDSTNPIPVPEHEVKRIANQIVQGAERVKPKVVFEKGDSVRIVDGPFVSFNGVVDEVESEKGKLRVLVSIFGRATPVEMEFVQVEKI